MAHGISRRSFLKSSALAAGAVGAMGTSGGMGSAGAEPTEDSRPLLRVAGYRYPRLEALADGRVEVEGCRTEYEVSRIGDMNTDVFQGPQSRDVTEIGLHPFMLAFANDGFRDYSLLPVFPLRLFRHKSVFVRTDRGIEGPQDLKGKRIATPGYSSTSLTWIRGIFQDEYGIAPEDIQWVVAQLDSSAGMSGKVSAQENVLPDGLTVHSGPAGMDESDLLESGEVDALFHAAEPRAYGQGHPQVARLFEDYRSVEQAYFAKTGIFPIMHAVAIKNETLTTNPWLAKAVFEAYVQAKQISYESMAKLSWAYDSLPWYGQELQETRALMGDNYYSYGIKPNRAALETLFRYSHEQGLSSRRLSVEEMFAPESLGFTDSSSF